MRIGSNMPPVRTVEQDEERVAQLLENALLAGCCYSMVGKKQSSALERLQQRAAIPLLVASDIERGVGQQVKASRYFRMPWRSRS